MDAVLGTLGLDWLEPPSALTRAVLELLTLMAFFEARRATARPRQGRARAPGVVERRGGRPLRVGGRGAAGRRPPRGDDGGDEPGTREGGGLETADVETTLGLQLAVIAANEVVNRAVSAADRIALRRPLLRLGSPRRRGGRPSGRPAAAPPTRRRRGSLDPEASRLLAQFRGELEVFETLRRVGDEAARQAGVDVTDAATLFEEVQARAERSDDPLRLVSALHQLALIPDDGPEGYGAGVWRAARRSCARSRRCAARGVGRR